jgi:hypothetical protein
MSFPVGDRKSVFPLRLCGEKGLCLKIYNALALGSRDILLTMQTSGFSIRPLHGCTGKDLAL